MRITTHMMMDHYRDNVSDAFASMNKAMQTTIDYRKFERPSDDPLAASQTFDVHWMSSLNDAYLSNVSDMNGTMATADTILQNLDKLMSNADTGSTLQAVNSTMNNENRQTLANQLIDDRNEIVSQMNSKYAGRYLFGGSNDTDAPFQMDGDTLYYRGINVDTGKMKDGSNPKVPLDKLADEATYIDIGLGMKTTSDGKIDPQSAFNDSMPGISFLGYGKDSSGNPKNVCSILTDIANKLKASSGESTLSTSELNSIQSDISTYRASHDNFQNGQAVVGQRMKFLGTTSDYLTEVNLNLEEKDNNVEFVSPYDAIKTFYSQSYCYSSALKVGSQVMQQSLMDYLK